MKKIPIFFTFNNDYAVPAAVAFYSLLQKSKNDVYYEMYVLHSDIDTESQQIIQNVIKRFKNVQLTFIDTKGFLKDEWESCNWEGNNTRNQFTLDTVLRCFGAKFFPQYDKIIYSDVDCVFVDDISELYDLNLDNKYVGAVRDPFMKYSEFELSHLKPEHYEKFKDSYFGGGIWVLNLKKIREDHLEQRMIEIIKDDTIIKRWNDQDIMNIACDNKVTYIPLNYILCPYMLDLMLTGKFTSHYTREELYDSLINPKIIHYLVNKPWNSNPKYSEIWWTIFYYLKLPKTSIFKKTDTNEKRYLKKYKKYKKLFKIFLSIAVILLFMILIITIKINIQS